MEGLLHGLFFHHGQAVFQGRPEDYRRQIQFEFPCFDLGEVRDILDQGEEMAAALQDIAEIFFLDFVYVADLLVGDDLDETSNRSLTGSAPTGRFYHPHAGERDQGR